MSRISWEKEICTLWVGDCSSFSKFIGYLCYSYFIYNLCLYACNVFAIFYSSSLLVNIYYSSLDKESSSKILKSKYWFFSLLFYIGLWNGIPLALDDFISSSFFFLPMSNQSSGEIIHFFMSLCCIFICLMWIGILVNMLIIDKDGHISTKDESIDELIKPFKVLFRVSAANIIEKAKKSIFQHFFSWIIA